MTNEEILCDANNLYQAYLNSIRGSKWKESTQKCMINYLRCLFKIQKQLKERTYQNGQTVEFEICERGKRRLITSFCIEDRIVRHVLCDNVLLPAIRKKIVIGNTASLKGRGTAFTRKNLEAHLRRYYREHGNRGYILLGDFSKFYDNIIHEIAIQDFLKLVDYDEYTEWLLRLIFQGFEVDVSYMTDDEFEHCMENVFVSLDHHKIPKQYLTGTKMMRKSVDVGDQIAQDVGIYYPHPIDTYVKYVRSQKYYQRYMDDWYIISPSKEELMDILENIKVIAASRGIHINEKKTKIVPLEKGFKFLQIRYTLTKSGKIIKKINPVRVTAMRRKLKKLAVKINRGDLDYESVENMFHGWMCDHYKLMSKEQRRNMISLYEALFNRTITICNRKMIFSYGGGSNG